MIEQQFVIAKTIDLIPHPQNPNRGNVGAISESIDANGFYGVVGFQKSTKRILFGNHRFEAAKLAGATELPALEMDVDDDSALRIMLVDNRSATFGENDNNMLADILSHLSTTSAELSGTGFTSEYLDELEAELGTVTQDFVGDAEPEEVPEAQYILTIHCDNESDLENLFQEMTTRGLTCKMLT